MADTSLDLGKCVQEVEIVDEYVHHYCELTNGVFLDLRVGECRPDEPRVITATVSGEGWTTNAINYFVSEYGTLIQSVFQLLYASATSSEIAKQPTFNINELLGHYGEDEELVYPRLSWLLKPAFVSCTASAVRCLIGSSPLTTRLGNAIQLFLAASQSNSRALMMTLNVGALDAVVGTTLDRARHSTKGVQLESRVIALLEPNIASRAEYEGTIQYLWNLRSACIHGESVNVSARLGEATRRIAAATIRAGIEWLRTNRCFTDGDALVLALDESSQNGEKTIAISSELHEHLKHLAAVRSLEKRALKELPDEFRDADE